MNKSLGAFAKFETEGMRLMRRLSQILLLISLVLIQPVLAVDPPGWVGPTTIKKMVVQPGSRIYVYLNASTPDLGCTGNDDGWLELKTSYPNFEQQFALLLAAHAAKREVLIYVSDCGYYPYAQSTQLLE